MPDRSSSQGLPDDWSHGSQSAHEPFPATGVTDAYGAGIAGAQGAGATDAYGTPATAAYRTGNADSFRTRTADPFRDTGPFGNADRFAEANRFADADRFAAADPFGEGGLFGPVTPGGNGAAAETKTAHADGASPAAVTGDFAPGAAADAKGFLSALFDFGFTSFVTPKVIKVLYMLIMTGTVVTALVCTIFVFKVSTAFGVVTLLVADPLFILIVMAIYRLILEFFVVAFRAAEDIRALRERGEGGL